MAEFVYETHVQCIRYASAIASTCGLQVSVEPAKCTWQDGEPEIPRHVWRGTSEQFRQPWFMATGAIDFTSFKHKRWVCPGWLRGHLFRDGPDSYRFVIEFAFGPTRQMERRISQQAVSDVAYQLFRHQLFQPVNLD